jgi:diacylglycerol kinase (ATP)
MPKNKDIFEATRNAFNGLRVLLQERSSQREVILIVCAISLFCLKANAYTVSIAAMAFILLAIEALNTAIEKLCNLYTTEIHPEIKIIKDLGAAALLIVSIAIGLLFIAYLCS